MSNLVLPQSYVEEEARRVDAAKRALLKVSPRPNKVPAGFQVPPRGGIPTGKWERTDDAVRRLLTAAAHAKTEGPCPYCKSTYGAHWADCLLVILCGAYGLDLEFDVLC